MGYTHYWRMERGNISPDAWSKIEADARKLIAVSPAKIAFEEDCPEEPPVCDQEQIRFNGIPEGCETFLLTPEAQKFEFCKTQGRPYDTIVCAILACAAEHAPEQIKVSSDGGPEDWKDPLAWASETLGRPVPLPLNQDEDA